MTPYIAFDTEQKRRVAESTAENLKLAHSSRCSGLAV
jgi:hypothetical protein